MARKVLIEIRRGTESSLTAGTLADGEFGYTTDTKKLFIGYSGQNICIGAASSLGDMLKSVYDTDNDGIVDKAEDSNTIGGLHANNFGRAYSSSYPFGGSQAAITTADFITLLNGLGAFSQPYWVARGSWAYAYNKYISDTGIGNIHLAGCTVEVIGNSSNYTIRIHTPTTTSDGTINTEYIYVNNGSSYSPGWRKIWNDKNDGPGSGLDADLLDGSHANSFVPKGCTWNDLKGV